MYQVPIKCQVPISKNLQLSWDLCSKLFVSSDDRTKTQQRWKENISKENNRYMKDSNTELSQEVFYSIND